MSTTSTETTPIASDAGQPVLSRSEARLGMRPVNLVKTLFGGPSQRRLARAALQIGPIRHWEAEYSRLSDAELRQAGIQLRGRARSGESLDRLLPQAFGAVCVAATRTLHMRPFDVQLAGGVIIHRGALAELATGEGKTLVAAMPTYLNGLTGKGAHVTTVNDYLARRDAEWMGPIYSTLGLTVGVLQMTMGEPERAKAYKCDITYGVASEFGFDFLRDRLKIAGDKSQAMPFWMPWSAGTNYSRPLDPKLQRGHNFALVDEADNIFIDEASTPLIISTEPRKATPDEQIVYLWADQVAKTFVINQHFILDDKKHKVELTEEGRQQARWSSPPFGPHSHAMDKLYEHLERAIHAHFRFRRDQHYIIEKDKVCIIDEFTGRRMPDRSWREGLHQAVEAKERVPITKASDHAAQITFQAYFRLYKKLAGMTGTAAQNWWEVRRVYKIWVVKVPTNRPVIREQWPDMIYPTEHAKFTAVAQKVAELRDRGRPVLIGTRSVAKSETLSEYLTRAGIEHQVLNAKQHEREANIVEKAGEAGKVTIATNMAGRGTDIKLGPGVAAAGGLHVLGTERHEARRIDRQLAGRAARQGDPGSCQFMLCLEDELLEGLGPDRQEHLQEIGRRGGNIDWQRYRRAFIRAQARVERRNYRQRLDLMVHDKQRREILKELAADPYVD